MKEFLKKAISPPNGWKEYKKDTEISLWVDGGIAYLAFQGSLSLTDWIYNFLAWSIFGTHYGMFKKYEEVSYEVMRFIKENEDNDIVFLGHSQGAGVALIALTEMASLFNTRTFKAYLFGCPKIFTLWKALSVRKYCRFVNQYQVRTDIVPFLSPVNIQVGNVIKLGEKKPLWKWRISDHYPSSYRRYL